MKREIKIISVREGLQIALKAEQAASDLYRNLKQRVANFVVRDKLDFLIGEEVKHERIISDLFIKMFPGEEAMLPEEVAVPLFDGVVSDEMETVDLFGKAVETEESSRDFYQRLAAESKEKSVKDILNYLSTVEESHRILLKGEYDVALVNQEYLSRGDFEYDMVHIGP